MAAMTVGDFQVDAPGNRLLREGNSVRVEPKVMRVLCCLAERAGDVVTREELLEHVWSRQVVEDDALSSAVIKLRKALGDSSRSPRYIETVPRRGYRLIATVQREEQSPITGAAGDVEVDSRPGIAVLPFIDLDPGAEQSYFARGLAEDIITALSRVRTFAVMSRGSSFEMGHLHVDPVAAGRALGVRFVLGGGVRMSAERLRVTAQLVDVRSGEQVWAERFDRDAADLFEVQDEITELVVGALEPELGFVERKRLRMMPPESLDAWGHYQRGLDHMYRRTVEDDALAEQEFRRAAAMDRNFAAPLAALAYTLAQHVYQNPDDEALRATTTEARDVAKRAIGLDPASAMAYCALGRALSNLGDHAPAVEASRRAVALNPSSATCARVLGFARLHAGEPDAAIAQFRRALALSPRDPETWSFFHGIAMAFATKREFEQALDWVERAIVAPNPAPWPFATRAAILGWLGRDEEAGEALEIAKARIPRLGFGLYKIIRDRRSRTAFYPICLEGLRRAGLEDS